MIFLSVLKLRDRFKWRAKKNEHGEGIMLIRTFVLKVINNERKKLTHHEINDRIAEQTAAGDHSREKRIKIEDSSELTEATFLIYLFI